jgi:hypothetical protein
MLRRFLGSMGLVSKEGVAVATVAVLERLLQEKDARLVELAREKDARLVELAREKDARLVELAREKDARLAELSREKDARLGEKDARLGEKDEAMRRMEIASAKDLALAWYTADIAESRISARALLEGALDGIWAKLPGGRSLGSSTTQQLAGLLKADGPCPGLLAYLRQAAVDNGVKESELLRQVGKLYDVVSERVHAEPVGGVSRVPADLFKQSGRTTLIAFAALACFSGRDLSLYKLGGELVPIKLRALRGDCTATQAHLIRSALMDHRMSAKEILS